jgi:uncharacterized membrane protein YoaK (UPF0700 family)
LDRPPSDIKQDPTPVISDKIKDLLLVMLTIASGTIDALGYFGLGGIFISALSGTTVVLGASLVQGQSTRALLGIFVFIGCIKGAAMAAFILRKERKNAPSWSARVTYTLGIELALLLVLFLGTYFNHNYSTLHIGLISLLLVASFSMGIQFICAKHINRIGVVTTMITGTLSSFISHLVNHRDEQEISFANQDKDDPSITNKEQFKYKFHSPSETTLFLVTVWIGYFSGAILSASVLLYVSLHAAIAIPFIIVLLVVSYAIFKQLKPS